MKLSIWKIMGKKERKKPRPRRDPEERKQGLKGRRQKRRRGKGGAALRSGRRGREERVVVVCSVRIRIGRGVGFWVRDGRDRGFPSGDWGGRAAGAV